MRALTYLKGGRIHLCEHFKSKTVLICKDKPIMEHNEMQGPVKADSGEPLW